MSFLTQDKILTSHRRGKDLYHIDTGLGGVSSRTSEHTLSTHSITTLPLFLYIRRRHHRSDAAQDRAYGLRRIPIPRRSVNRRVSLLQETKHSRRDLSAPDELIIYAGLCGWTLAWAHARSGDRVQIAGYLGNCERFDTTVVDFAEAYPDQTERDHGRTLRGPEVGQDPGRRRRFGESAPSQAR